MILAAFVCRLDWKNAWRIFKRDRYNHASPNSAQTEAVMAGALDVALAGNAYYLENYMKRKRLEMRFAKLSRMTLYLQTACFMWQQQSV